jgi:hypothetical protein
MVARGIRFPTSARAFLFSYTAILSLSPGKPAAILKFSRATQM